MDNISDNIKYLKIHKFSKLEMESAPRNIEVRPLSSSTMVITWSPPEIPNGQINGYKVVLNKNIIMSSLSLKAYSIGLLYLKPFTC